MPSLLFLNQPDYLLPQVVDFLTEGWAGGLLDLSESILVLPTQEARRRLHEALVRKASSTGDAASHGAALLPPIWMLPMQLPEGMKNLEGEHTNFAPSSLEQILWIEVITGMSREESLRLFPRKTPLLDPPRAAALADSIRSLRGELSQAGITLRDAEAQHPADPRWKTLIALEERYLNATVREGFTDRISAQLEGARSPIISQGIKRIVIATVPDLPKIYETMIPLIEAQGIKVTILIFDPMGYGSMDSGNGFFDSLGRPSDAWAETPIPIERSSIHLCLDRAEESEKAAHLVQASGGNASIAAVGVSASELAEPMEKALQTLDIPAFNPAGVPLDTLPIGRLLGLLATQLREGNFRATLQLLRHPDIQKWLGLDPLSALKALDELENHLIPSSLPDLLERWPILSLEQIEPPFYLNEALQRLNALISTLDSGQGTAPLLQSLSTIYGATDLALISGGKESVERIRSWMNGAESLMATVRSRDLLTLLLTHLQSGISTGEKKPASVELPGWLELLWEDAPHLIVAGMNDGLVPETRQEDPFLHEKLRIAWGLASDASRLRRDSYLLLSMLAARSQGGRLDLLLARQDEEGAVLKPSRLLLRCADDAELPILVQELFRELTPRPNEKWRAAWALKPARRTSPRTLSASALKVYLDCPTRFYLQHVLKLKAEKFGAEEADAATFGNLLHATLREFGNEPRLRDLRDREQIESALVRIWKESFDARYGPTPSFPLMYQREAGIRRLRGAAEAQAKLRAEGWEIIACERKFRDFPLSGMRLNGQIDRIDRRITSGKNEWRIIDYKSSEADKDPDDQHYRRLGKHDDPTRLAPYECFKINEKAYRWIDLQLPLYRMVLLSDLAEGGSSYLELDEISDIQTGSVEVGYFTLPSKVSGIKFSLLKGMQEHEASAHACLNGALRAIHQGIFWPPRQPKYDSFSDLLFDHLESGPSSGQQTLDPIHLQPEEVA